MILDPLKEADAILRASRLTQGQIQVLALVADHYNSKEIAARLGISPHTVDQRIRTSLATLGVERRSEAARLVVLAKAIPPISATDSDSTPSQQLIYQPPHLPLPDQDGQQDPATGHQIRQSGCTGEAGTAAAKSEQVSPTLPPLVWPIATRANPRNRMGIGGRLMWIILIALGASFAAGMFLAGLESLARLVGS